MNHLRISGLLLIFCAVVAVQPAHAQQDPQLEVGMKPFGAYNGGNIDTVSLFHGQLSLDIPLISYPQRGGKLKLDYHLRYANVGVQADYFKITIPPPGQGNIHWYSAAPPSGWCGNSGMANYQLCHGFRVVDEQSVGDYITSSTATVGPYTQTAVSPSVFMPDGGMHPLFPTCGTCLPSVWESVDGTSFRLQCYGSSSCPGWGYNLSGTTIVDSEGVNYVFPTSGQAYRQDTNGNTITYSGSGVGLTDTMGRVIPSIPAPTSNVAGCPQPPSVPYAPSTATTWNPPGVNGGSYPIMFCYIQISETNPIDFQYNDGPWVPAPYTGTELQSVVLPNGTSWTFEYTADGNADLSEVIFPTGGTLSYGSWQNVAGSGVPGFYVDYNRALGTRILNPNDGVTPASTWTYTYNSPSVLTTTVSSPPSSGTTPDDTVHTFATLNAGSPYEIQTQYYQGSHSTGVLLKTVNTQFSYQMIPWGGFSYLSAINIVPIQTATVWANGQQNKTTYAYDSGVQIYQPTWLCPGCNFTSIAIGNAIYGKVPTKSEYDYGNGAPGSLMRTTTNTYLALNNSSYLSANLLDLVSSVQIKDGGGTQRAYTTYSYDGSSLISSGITTQHNSAPPNGNTRGNLTSVARWLNTTGAYLTSTNTYFDTGMVNVAKDPKLNPTTYAYSSTYVGAFPTTITNALNQFATSTYDFNTGLLNSTTDPNNQTTSYQYDQMLRTTEIDRPDGGQTTLAYPTPTEVDITQKIDASHNKTSSLLVDGVGRKIRQIASNGESTPYDQSDTTYDGLGHVKFSSYPYQGNGFPTARVTSGAGDSFAYDALGRAATVTHSDNSTITTLYSGPTTTVTDEQGKARQSTADGLGRLKQVIEDPGTSPHLNYTTAYTYDALDNLAGVTQASSRQRTFVYDSLSRLTSSTNPEANWAPATQTNVATTYSYDANSNLVNKTGPAPNQQSTSTITLTFCYDALNRLTAKGYTSQTCANGWLPTPVATYVYDGGALPSGCSVGSFSYGLAIGKRTAMCDAAGSEAWSYNIVSGVGWQTTDQRTTNSLTKTAVYQSNLLGLPTSIQYPSGRIITYSYNLGARPISATDGTTSVNYANTVHYWAGGAPCWAAFGGAITTAATFNSRLQPLAMQATSGVVPFTTCAGLGQTGNLIDFTYNFSLGSGDNGNVMGITNNRDTTRSQTFTYDALNRVATATASTYATSPTHCWGESFGYDTWGNFLSIGVASSAYTGCTQESLSVTASAQNRISTSGYTYDTAGNMTAGPPTGTTYTYNAENQMTQAATSSATGYVYDGDGKRVEKTAGGVPSKLYWYGLGGDALDETDGTGSTTNSSFNEYVFFSGKRIAKRDASNNVFYYAADHLGTSRVIAQVPAGQSSATLCYDADFYPFGGERPPYTNTCSQNYKFTGKERDSESSLDNFGARYNASSLGRFMSADPKPRSARAIDPQRWNRYTYARNNPLQFVDPDGMDIMLAEGLSHKDQSFVVNHLARMYATPAGRAMLERADQSKFTVTVGTGHLGRTDVTKAPPGTVVFGGQTKVEGGNTIYGTGQADGHTLLVAKSPDAPTAPSIQVVIDKDQSAEIGKDPAKVFAHEIGGHTADVINAAESNPSQFIDSVNPKDETSSEAAEKALGKVPSQPTQQDTQAVEEMLRPRLPQCNVGEPKVCQ